MKNILQIILITLFTFVNFLNCFSQKPPGYIGKQNILGLSFTGSMRVLSGMNNGYLKTVYEPDEDNNDLIGARHILRGGINAEYFRITGRNIGFGLKFQYNRVGLSSGVDLRSFEHSESNFPTTYYVNTTSAEFKSYAIKPTIVFNSKPGFLPIGLRHTISIGPRFVSLNTNKDYFYETEYDDFGFPIVAKPELINKPNEDFSNKLNGIDIGYNGSITYPISNSLIFEIGYEFRVAWLRENNASISSNRKYFQNDNSVESSLSEAYYNRDFIPEIRGEVLGRIFSMNMGLIFAF